MSARSLTRTASYNVVRMGSGFGLVAVLPILARRLDADEYRLWILVGQVPGYVALVASGLSVAVVRLVAGTPDVESRRAAVDVGARYGLIMALTSIAGVGMLAITFPLLFRDVPEELHEVARVGVLTLGVGAAWGLIGTAYWSYFNAIKDNGRSATMTAIVRLGGAALVVVTLPAGLAVMFITLGASFALGDHHTTLAVPISDGLCVGHAPRPRRTPEPRASLVPQHLRHLDSRRPRVERTRRRSGRCARLRTCRGVRRRRGHHDSAEWRVHRSDERISAGRVHR
jgi:hypothetical protein